MKIKNKIYSVAEMKERDIFTVDYRFMDTPCTVVGTLVLKAQARGNMLRLFFRLEDGSKIITVVYWWQKYLGFYEQPVGATFLLRYVKNNKGGSHLDSAETVDRSMGNAMVQEQRA